MNSILGAICARAGSRGLPRKHVLPLGGRPLIEWTFEAAKAAKRLTRTVVSSNDPQILRLAQDAGLAVRTRPSELAGDTAPIQAVLRDLLAVEADQGRAYDAFVLLYGNIPLRAPGLIDQCVAALDDTEADAVLTVQPVGKFHPYWMQVRDQHGFASPFHETNLYRRQDLPPLYIHDGAVVVGRLRRLLHPPVVVQGLYGWLGDRIRLVVQDHLKSVDVDTALDFHVAEALLRQAQAKEGFI